MFSTRSLQRLLLTACLLSLGSLANAQAAWVTDQFEITLRTGPSTSNAIRVSLASGTRLEVLENDADSGYSRVRTGGGTEGWVLTRYLMNEPSAREQLAELRQRLSSATDEGSTLAVQLNEVQGEFREAEQTNASLEREKQVLENELEEIRRTAANVLAINSRNQELQEKLTNNEIETDRLSEEVRMLSGQSNRGWFITGALVLLGGIVLGLILPKMRWQRRSRYDTF